MEGVNSNKDVNIDFNLLSATISKLKIDNEKISEVINKIYDNVKKINDEEVWKSPEKDKIMNELMPYLDDTKTSLYSDLNSCLDVLNKALNDYKETDDLLKTGAREIAEIVEE